MMYTTVAEFAEKEAELSERLMKIGLMHDIPIMNIGEKPNLKSRMKFLAFVPRNSEQGVEGSHRANARTKLKGSQRPSMEKLKTEVGGPNGLGSKRKSGKSGKSKAGGKDTVTAGSSGNLTSRSDRSRAASKSNHHVTSNEAPERTDMKLKGRRKQQNKSQERNNRYPAFEKKSFEVPSALPKAIHFEQSDTQAKKTRRAAFMSSRSLEYETMGIGNGEKLKARASKELHKDLASTKEPENVNSRDGHNRDKRQKPPPRNLKRSFSSVELGRFALSKKDRKGKKKGKARFPFKRRITSVDLDLEEELTGIMKETESLTEKFEHDRVSTSPRKSPAPSPAHNAYKLTQSDEERIRFNSAFIRHLEESELEERVIVTVPPSPFSQIAFKGNTEHFNAARECFHIYQTLEERGFRIPLKTLHRGLMTPTEMRILEEIRKSSKNLMDVSNTA